MWEPDPAWRRLAGAGGPSTAGLWLAGVDGRTWVVKRSGPRRPTGPCSTPPTRATGDARRRSARTPGVTDRTRCRRSSGPSRRTRRGHRLERGGTGDPPRACSSPGAGTVRRAPYDAPPWGSRRLLADRLDMAVERGGWPTLARTTLADVTDRLWRRREHWLPGVPKVRRDGCTETRADQLRGGPRRGRRHRGLAVPVSGPSVPTWLLRAVEPGGVRRAARHVPRGRRRSHRSRGGRARRPGDRGLQRGYPRGVGVGPGRARRSPGGKYRNPRSPRTCVPCSDSFRRSSVAVTGRPVYSGLARRAHRCSNKGTRVHIGRPATTGVMGMNRV